MLGRRSGFLSYIRYPLNFITTPNLFHLRYPELILLAAVVTSAFRSKVRQSVPTHRQVFYVRIARVSKDIEECAYVYAYVLYQ